jgi:hypothetical protein
MSSSSNNDVTCTECSKIAHAVSSNHMKCLERLHSAGCRPSGDDMKAAITVNNVSMLRYMHQEMGGDLDCPNYSAVNYAFDRAVLHKNEHACLAYCLGELDEIRECGAMYMMMATVADHEYSVLMLKLLYDNNVPGLNVYATFTAANRSNLPALKYLHSIGCPWDRKVLTSAKGECLQYAKDHGCPDVDMCYDLDVDFKIVKKYYAEIHDFFRKNERLFGRHKRSLDGTCRSCKTQCDAAFLGHLDCFDRLQQMDMSIEVMRQAVLGGHLDMIQNLLDEGYQWPMETTSYACALNRPMLLHFALDNGCVWDHERAMSLAVLAHSDACLKIAVDRGCHFYNLVYHMVAAEGQLKMLRYLLEYRRMPFVTPQCLCRAKEGKHASTLLYLLEKGNIGCGTACRCETTSPAWMKTWFDQGGTSSKQLSTSEPLSSPAKVPDLEDRLKAKQKDMPKEWYEDAMMKLKTCTDSSNKDKAQAYVEKMLKVPFNKFMHHPLWSPPVKDESSRDNINKYFESAQKVLEEAVHGMEPVKEEVLNFVAQLISTKNLAKPRVLGLCGSPGIGKTAIVRRGLASAIGRKMVCINMGGIKDSDHFLGHGYTYVGSQPGIIVRSLIELGVMNGIIFMDEVDKVSSVDIQNILMHITDPLQSATFNDKYFAGLNVDLSNIIFVFSYNDSSKIDPVLRDRIYEIKIDDPSLDDKTIIGCKYLVKELVATVGLKETDVVFKPEVMRHMLKTYCADQAGVRRLKSCLQTLLLKINTAQYMTVSKYKCLQGGVTFPLEVTKEMTDELLADMKAKADKFINMMYA